MQRYKKEVCRNFQRGFCQYGERCKFLHQQQQQQQQTPQSLANSSTNSFAFGNSTQRPQLNPFENKWSRFPSNANTPQHPQQRSDSKPQAVTNHDCGDPESCKRIIVEDFLNERPLWKLTCYGHWKCFPCDITGDISLEELRAASYEDTRCGLGIHSIVERERSLLNSKLLEFENFQRSLAKSSLSTDRTFSVSRSFPPSVSSFSQLGASLNLGVGQRGNLHNVRPPAPAINIYDQNHNPQASSASFGNVLPRQQPDAGRLWNTEIAKSNSGAGVSQGSTTMGALRRSNELLGDADVSAFSSPPVRAAIAQSVNNNAKDNLTVQDLSIWRKLKWSVGEIPEEAPPDAVVAD